MISISVYRVLPKPTQFGNLSHRFLAVSIRIFQELPFFLPVQNDLNVYVPRAVSKMNRNHNKRYLMYARSAEACIIPEFSPYARHFAGRRIRSGATDLALVIGSPKKSFRDISK